MRLFVSLSAIMVLISCGYEKREARETKYEILPVYQPSGCNGCNTGDTNSDPKLPDVRDGRDGRDGLNGRDGRDGRDGNNGCCVSSENPDIRLPHPRPQEPQAPLPDQRKRIPSGCRKTHSSDGRNVNININRNRNDNRNDNVNENDNDYYMDAPCPCEELLV
jgi:hypothetical protein